MLEKFFGPTDREIFLQAKETRGVIERDREKRRTKWFPFFQKHYCVTSDTTQFRAFQSWGKKEDERESQLLYKSNLLLLCHQRRRRNTREGEEIREKKKYERRRNTREVNGMDRTISCSWSVRREGTKYILQVYNRDNGVCNDDDDNDDAFEFLFNLNFSVQDKEPNRMTGILLSLVLLLCSCCLTSHNLLFSFPVNLSCLFLFPLTTFFSLREM